MNRIRNCMEKVQLYQNVPLKHQNLENFSLGNVQGDVKLHKATVLQPFSTTLIREEVK